MRYIVTDGGIQFTADEPPEIPIVEAVKVCRDIADKIEALDCECEQQGCAPCGNCDRPPLRRPA